MSRTVGVLSSTDVRLFLKRITKQDFIYSNERPDDTVFALRDHNICYEESLCLEWVVKNKSGILFITEPITRASFWKLPEDLNLGDLAKDEAMNDLFDQYNTYLQSVYQGVYLTNSKYHTNIKMDGESEPRLFLFLDNYQNEEMFVTAIAALEHLLPKLQLSA